MNRIKKVVSEICNGDSCLAPFTDCERKCWQRTPEYVPMKRYGASETCPLLQFEAEEDEDKRPWHEKVKAGIPPYRITEKDTWRVCQECEHSKIVDGYIEIEHAYMDHCVDCPVNGIRESIMECAAEAAIS